MKIICLLGSPREKGNSSAVAKHYCGEAEKLGAEVRIFALNKLHYRGCQGLHGLQNRARPLRSGR